MVSLIQATIGTVLGPLVGQLDAQRLTIERMAGELREVEREVGALRAENQALRGAQAVETSIDTFVSIRRSWVRLWPVLAILVVLVVAGGMWLVPR
jgi:hypothetical protein